MMADLIDRKVAMDALGKIQYWNPEDRYRAMRAVSECPAAEQKSAVKMFEKLGYHMDINDGVRMSFKNDRGDTVIVTPLASLKYHCGVPAPLFNPEALACAQCIEEMAVTSNG